MGQISVEIYNPPGSTLSDNQHGATVVEPLRAAIRGRHQATAREPHAGLPALAMASFVKSNGEIYYLWRAVDHENEILESYVSRTCDKAAALRFIKKR